MNYVAHLYLTHPEEDLSIGNLLGDLVANNLLGDLTPPHRHGVRIHRFIDSYTDNHKSLDEARQVLRTRHRKYAPVVLDLLLDFVLVEDWGTYGEGSFDLFQQWVYDTIESRSAHVPQSAAIRLQHMARGRWLNSYTTLDRFQKVLDRMDRRARFESHFGDALLDLDEHGALLRSAFAELMDSLKPKVADMMAGFSPRNGEKS